MRLIGLDCEFTFAFLGWTPVATPDLMGASLFFHPDQSSCSILVNAAPFTGDLPGVSGLKWRRPLAETNDGIHIVALLEMGIQVHWAVENVLSYSTRP